ncbi:MAG TPA: dihydrofolate reductase [Pseudobdellovibrionaceae bacterium]|nr:dihydrofolate reductase [Pseudobdellovibrionaceae bacterium]
MILSHIVACSQNRVIGSQNTLPWHIPEDFAFFKSKTKGHILIMGRKTFESLPGLLPQRLHIVITRNPEALKFENKQARSPEVLIVNSLEKALELAKSYIPEWPQEVFIIGGGEIYQQSLSSTHKIYLTIIHEYFHGDTSYPEINMNDFILVEKRDRAMPVPFTFLTYENSKNLSV